MDWLDLLAVQGTLKSLLQHHSSKASILRHSAFFTIQLSHPYMTTGKTIALTRQTLVGKVMSLLLNMLSTLVIILTRCKQWKSLSPVWLFATPWTIQSMEFSRPEYWSGWPFLLLQEIFPTQESNPGLQHCRRILYQLSHKVSQWLGAWQTFSEPKSWATITRWLCTQPGWWYDLVLWLILKLLYNK